MLRVTCHSRHSELVYDILGAHEEIVQVCLGLKRGKRIRELLSEHADGREEEDRPSTSLEGRREEDARLAPPSSARSTRSRR